MISAFGVAHPSEPIAKADPNKPDKRLLTDQGRHAAVTAGVSAGTGALTYRLGAPHRAGFRRGMAGASAVAAGYGAHSIHNDVRRHRARRRARQMPWPADETLAKSAFGVDHGATFSKADTRKTTSRNRRRRVENTAWGAMAGGLGTSMVASGVRDRARTKALATDARILGERSGEVSAHDLARAPNLIRRGFRAQTVDRHAGRVALAGAGTLFGLDAVDAVRRRKQRRKS